MPARFHCRGKIYPMALHAAAAQATQGRPLPHVWYTGWTDGHDEAAAFNSVFHFSYFAGSLFGLNPRTNWNSEEYGPWATNVSTEYVSDAAGWRLIADFQRTLPSSDVAHTRYAYGPIFPIDVLINDQLPLTFLDHVGGPRLILDTVVQMFRGTYGRIPANSCLP